MRSLKLLIPLAIILIAFPAAVTADTIVLKDGPAKLGIIQEETSTAIKLRVEDAVLTIPRSSIQSIGYAAPDENQALEEKWKTEEERRKQDRAKKRDEEAKVEAGQKEKGLVNVDGRWVSSAEAEKLKREEIRKQTKEQKVVSEPGVTAGKATGPGATTSPKIIIDLSDEAKEIIDVQFKKLEPISGNAGPIERAIRSILKEEGIKDGTPVFTVTNKTDMCVSVDFYIEAQNEASEMVMELAYDLGALEPHESRPSNIMLTNNMKEVRVSIEEMEVWDFKPGPEGLNSGCSRFGEDGHTFRF